MAPHSSIYKPLDSERSHIRLVTIHPKDLVSQQIKCDLETFSLDEQLDYEALSYVWGDQGSETEILLNGQVFPVRRNLAFALKDLRLADRPRRLWIDAICVNQGDHKERSSQVLLMRYIYRYASRVVVWLGICTPENLSALNLLRTVKEMMQWNGSEGASAMPSQSDIGKVRNYLDTDMSAKEALWYLFCHLLMQAWWGRVWVIQEVAVSSKATVVIGDSELEWSSLCDAIGIIIVTGALFTESAPVIDKQLESIFSLFNIRVLRKRIKQGSLPSISTLVASNQTAATDQRDLVYAFLGLAKECDHPLLTPNYSDSNTASATFINLIEYSVRIENTLDIICLSQGRIRNDFPSWCPDWTSPSPLCWHSAADVSDCAPAPLIPTHINFSANNPWHACGDKSTVATIIRLPLTLACKGLLVDVVEVIGDPIVIGSWNQIDISLHSWESLILNHFKGLKSKMTQAADGPSIFDVSDQYHKLTLMLQARINLATAIVGSLKTMSNLIYSSYRSLRKLRMRTKLIFQGFHSQYLTGESLAEAYMRTLITDRLAYGSVMADDDYRLFWSRVPKSLDNPAAPSPAPFGISLYDGVAPSTTAFLESLVLSMVKNTWARTLVLTKKGYLGLGPPKTRKGDLVCILYGCSVPVIIRKYGQGHRFVGESYIHGLMYGAAVDEQSLKDTFEEREFILR